MIAARLACLLGCFVIAAGMVSSAQPALGDDSVPPNIEPIDLAKMVLPLSAFGPDYSAFRRDAYFGFEPGALYPHEVAGYSAPFTEPGTRSPAIIVRSYVKLFDTPEDAGDYIAGIIELLQAEVLGGTYTPFDVSTVPNAQGVDATYPLGFPDRPLEHLTALLFRLDRLVGSVTLRHFDTTDRQSEATNDATALYDRMKGVLTGAITDLPGPLPPDVNCDGSVDAVDATLILQLSAGLASSLSCELLGDANRDGSVNAVDATLILQFSAFLIPTLPLSAT